VTERELREALRSVPVDEARARSLDVVRAAYRAREPVPVRRRWAPALAVVACALAAAVIAASLNAPGDAVGRWVREVLGTGHPHPRAALVRVPGGGRLLVSSGGGAWAVAPDGMRRRLGDYAGASWSPRGLYVVAWRGGELVAMEPNGRVHWSLARQGLIAAARWAPIDGYRIAYIAGRTLRIVNGDGTGDRRFARVRAIAPAWRPDRAHVLAYVARGRVRVAAVDANRQIWTVRARGVTKLAWSPDGRRLAVVTPRHLLVVARGRTLERRAMPDGMVLDDASWSPSGRLVLVRRGARTSEVVIGGRVLFTGPGRFGAISWSPNGRRLLVPWPAADQWLFLDAAGGRAAAVGNIDRQFGGSGPVEWCCR
jgi:WD40 repeat protein